MEGNGTPTFGSALFWSTPLIRKVFGIKVVPSGFVSTKVGLSAETLPAFVKTMV